MQIQLVTLSDLKLYSTIPISFMVNTYLEISTDAAGVFHLKEKPVPQPWKKEYDLHETPGSLPEKWDLSNWAIFMVSQAERPIGGCIIAHNTPQVNMLQGRSDLAVLWDIRVDTAYRGQGVGRRLFDTSIYWARSRGCTEMQIETQQINVNACRFYQRLGCTLIQVKYDAYAECPGEHQLIWSRQIGQEPVTTSVETGICSPTDP